jgi:ribosomal protein L9
LKDKVINIGLKFGANGKAFGSITKQEVFAKLTELKVPADKKMILDFEPIKTEGEYKIVIQFMKEVKCEVKVVVTAVK